MSRRLIVGILVLLIIGVVGGAVVLLANRLRQGATPSATPTPSAGTLTPAQTGEQTIANPTGDDDGDGLLNSDEKTWGTHTTNQDTDGDGFSDGEEVKAGHNPTIPAPNDLLPPGFEPGKNLTPLNTTVTQPVAVDQLFEANLDLNLSGKNYTEEYKGRFGENDRTPETLAMYINEQQIVTKLPTPLNKTIQLESKDTRASLEEYLTLAGNLSPFSNADIVASALSDLVTANDPSSVRGLALQVRLHQESLLEAHVPPSAENLHRLLLGYSELMAATYDVMAGYGEDPVKAAVGIRQLEANDKTYIPLITQELERVKQVAAGIQ